MREDVLQPSLMYTNRIHTNRMINLDKQIYWGVIKRLSTICIIKPNYVIDVWQTTTVIAIWQAHKLELYPVTLIPSLGCWSQRWCPQGLPLQQLRLHQVPCCMFRTSPPGSCCRLCRLHILISEAALCSVAVWAPLQNVPLIGSSSNFKLRLRGPNQK